MPGTPTGAKLVNANLLRLIVKTGPGDKVALGVTDVHVASDFHLSNLLKIVAARAGNRIALIAARSK